MTPIATTGISPHTHPGQRRDDPFEDFAPLAHLANFHVGLGVGTGVPVKTLAEYVAWVKADPDKNGFYGSAAPGSIPHFLGVMFAPSAGLTLTPAGTPPAVPDRIAKAAMAAVADPALNRKLVEMGLEPAGHGPDRLATILKADDDRWGLVIKASGFRPDQ